MLHIGICDDNQKDISRVQNNWLSDFQNNTQKCLYRYRLTVHHMIYWMSIEKTGGFDLYLLDVVMPHMTGVTLARRIRERKREQKFYF